MLTLLTYAGPAAPDAPVTRTGGIPLVPAGFAWPRCRECAGPMQFLGQISLDPGLFSVFMCQNEPGLCDEWEADAGGNRAYVFDGPLVAADVPPGPTSLDEVSAMSTLPAGDADYAETRYRWTEATGRSPREVLGQIGDRPSWIQGDQTPTCADCARPMTFVVQLEEGHDDRTAMNFGGGGCGYGFRCLSCTAAAFLWQC